MKKLLILILCFSLIFINTPMAKADTNVIITISTHNVQIRDVDSIIITILIKNTGSQTIFEPGWSYTYILTFPDGTTKEIYRPPSNTSYAPIAPGQSFQSDDNISSFLDVDTNEKIKDFSHSQISIIARYKSSKNPYIDDTLMPYSTEDSNELLINAENGYENINSTFFSSYVIVGTITVAFFIVIIFNSYKRGKRKDPPT